MFSSRSHNDIANLLKELGEDPGREGLLDTPKRFLAALAALTDGYSADVRAVAKVFADGGETYDEMITQGSIPIFSLCEHHVLPFWGKVHIGYMPDKKIIGLSKMSRIVDIFSHRLQVQERLTDQIAKAIADVTGAKGVGVVIRCRHLCMEMRGVRKAGTVTYTSSMLGAMRADASVKNEFLQFVQLEASQSGTL